MIDGALWAFSLDFYGRADVADACIALQDGHGADVDILLFTLWCARRGRRLGTAELDAIESAVGSWRSAVVQPLRQARRALDPAPSRPFDPADAAALRARLLTAEIEAERQQQGAMEVIAPPPGDADPHAAARDNLDCYARHASIPVDAAPFAVLLRAFA